MTPPQTRPGRGDAQPSRPPVGGTPEDYGRHALPGPLVYQLWALLAAAWFLLDQATKAWAVARLEGQEAIDLGWMDLRFIRNPGGAFGIPGLFPGLFVVVTVIVVVLVLRALPRTDRLWLAAAYGLVTGGALGNVADRLFRDPGFPSGKVVDFFDLGWWPVFNVADIGIVTGAALIALLLLVVDREERASAEARASHRSIRPETTDMPPRSVPGEPAPRGE